MFLHIGKINLDVYMEVLYLWGGGWVGDTSVPMDRKLIGRR